MTKWIIYVTDPVSEDHAFGPYATKEAASKDVPRWFDVAFDEEAEAKKAEVDLTSDYIETYDNYGEITLTLIELSWF